MNKLIEQANQVFLQNFKPEAWFERAIFFSWYCSTRDCKFCYMTTQKAGKMARRTVESLLAEVVLCKHLGWKIGFVSGGHNAYTTVEFESVIKLISEVAEEKLWINIGALKKDELRRFLPYAKGVVASIETINPKIHDFVCPSKPLAPFEEMFEYAEELGLGKAMAVILGLGETMQDFELLEKFIKRHNVEKIHFYSLNPQKGTYFEQAKRPTAEYQAEWIARTRIAFPRIDIQAGIWLDSADRVPLLLQAGANSISKFPAIRYFNSEQARQIEAGAKLSVRKFLGTLSSLKEIEPGSYLNTLSGSLKSATVARLNIYLKMMKKR